MLLYFELYYTVVIYIITDQIPNEPSQHIMLQLLSRLFLWRRHWSPHKSIAVLFYILILMENFRITWVTPSKNASISGLESKGI